MVPQSHTTIRRAVVAGGCNFSNAGEAGTVEMQKRRPVMLVVLDGWGWREETADNAIRQARTPSFDHLWATCPHAFLHTSGEDVGLPSGQIGRASCRERV